jgi:hypothetical protein
MEVSFPVNMLHVEAKQYNPGSSELDSEADSLHPRVSASTYPFRAHVHFIPMPFPQNTNPGRPLKLATGCHSEPSKTPKSIPITFPVEPYEIFEVAHISKGSELEGVIDRYDSFVMQSINSNVV